MCHHIHARDRERVIERYRDIEQPLEELEETSDPEAEDREAEPVVADD